MARPEKNVLYRPLLILAYVDSAHAAQCGRYFRRLGWEVHLVASAAEARRLSATGAARALVLDTELPDESGWLTCAKITQEDPARKVILLAPDRLPETGERLADVNAVALVTRHDPMEVLAEAVLGRQLAEAI
ncbi:MAG TPA: response regulator [Gemmataceae bacterium]|nr:response regulator [Gemmataceae bacterium]